MAVLAAPVLAPQSHASASGQRFGAHTNAVLVDVSVTDRRGHPITDLSEGEFQIFEDGVLQTILTFARHEPNPAATSVDAARAAGPIAGSTAPTVDRGAPARGPSIVALAFDRLSPEGRVLAARAAEQFIAGKQADELAGVFIVDQALGIVAPYTTDPQKLRAAVKRVASTATTQLARDQRYPELERFYASADVPWVAAAEQQGRTEGQLPWVDPVERAARAGGGPEAAIVAALLRMQRSYDDMLYEMQGQASMNALLALVDSFGALEGRKALIYFCEGLTIPPSAQPKYKAIIDNANRLNVTVYSMDVAGLRVQSKQSETARGVQEIGAMGVGDVRHGDKYLQALEDNERLLLLDPSVSLGILATQTGGLLIDNTNDLARGIRTIDDDRRNYYLLGYVPTNPVEDGTFRRVSVLVSRRGVAVRARSGYRATPRSDAGPVLAYETPALNALAANPAPADIHVDVGAYSVPTPGRPGLSEIFVNVPGSSLSFLTHADTKRYEGEVVILVRVRGAAGELPRKLSQQYTLSGELDRLTTTREKRILFYRMPELMPGEHPVEIAVHDGMARRDSVVRTTLRIPPPGRPTVGDLILVDHAEPPAAGESISANPLVANGLRLVPAFRGSFSKRLRTEINFALRLVLDAGGSPPPAKLTLIQNDQPLSSVVLELPPPDPAGGILAVGRVPIAAIEPGRYELRATIGTGSDAQTRTALPEVTE